MNSSQLAIEIIPDVTIDDKYAAIIAQALARITSFTNNALRDNRLPELFMLDKTNMTIGAAAKILVAKGRFLAGFQFETRSEELDDNFRVFVRKQLEDGTTFKFYLTPTVQEIMLQLISLEDRRTVAIFSMLNSSMEVGYRVLTKLYANQLRRLVIRAPIFVKDGISTKIEKIAVSKSQDDPELWKVQYEPATSPSGGRAGNRPGSQDNILQVMMDDSVFAELNQYVENVISRSERIKAKRQLIEENPDMPREEMYEQMVREDLDQLENCYARIHIYLKAFYKNKDRRVVGQNRVLRQFFGSQIEKITGETSLLEDLLSLNEEEYFTNISRHKEL
ncbi:MAG: hypothetical protein HY913_01195 [Desulfomonile tiedjei]|nr:hypothetical protein [Desulfomonile tiedjei]